MKINLFYKLLIASLFITYFSTVCAQNKGDSIIQLRIKGNDTQKPIDDQPLKPLDPENPADSIGSGGLIRPVDPPVPSVNPAKPNIPNVSNNCTVGTSKGNLTVNGTGAAEYNMVISCPNGGSLTPKISLAYNSQNIGYGLAGYGFTVTGISTITRGEKTLFNNNGSVKGITYTASDNLFLDGKRLILQSGYACQEGAVYYLEGDPYTKIIAHGSYNNSTATTWFEVKTSDGKTYQYGNASTARVSYKNNSGYPRIASWYVNRLDDVYGNYITYTYSISNLYAYLNTITYGTNTNKSRGITNKIVFEYQSLGSNRSVFTVEDQKGKIDKCISAITTSCNNLTYRKYLLTYESGLDQSTCKYTYLIGIQEKNGSGEEMKPVEFNWSYLPFRAAYSSRINVSTKDNSSWVEEEGKSFLAADMNGDGVSDIIRISPSKVFDNSTQSHGETRVYISRSKVSSIGNVSYQDPIVFSLPSVFSIDGIVSDMGGMSLMDFDGDGYNDMVFPFLNHASGYWSNEQFYVVMGSDVVAGRVGSIKSFPISLLATDRTPLYATFDTDRDGKDEIVCVEQSKKDGSYPAIIVKMKEDAGIEQKRFTVNLPSDPGKMFCGDYNNDGLTDIIFLYDGGYKIYFNNGGTKEELKFTESNCKTGTNLGNYWRFQQGDFDGDGLMDFVYNVSGETWLWVARNNGDGTFTCTKSDDIGVSDHASNKDDSRFSIMVYDIDHDGKSDVVVCKAGYVHRGFPRFRNEYTNTQVKWLYSDGTTLNLSRSIEKNRENDAAEGFIFLGDFDGDGNMELANYGSDLNSSNDTFMENWLYVYRNSSDLLQTGKITSVVDGMGNRTDIRYASATNPLVCTRTTSNTTLYPVNTYTLPMSLVRSVKSTNGVVGSQTVEYLYKDFKLHIAGAGPLGFAEIKKKNTTTGEETITGITKWDQTRWIPIETKVTNTIGDKTSTIICTNTVENVNNTYFAYESGSKVTDMDGNTAITISHYDKEKGVILDQTVKNDGDRMYKKVAYSGYQNKSGMWLPTVMTMTQKHADDASPYSKRTIYSYDNKGNILTTTVNSGTPLALTTTATYDIYGNRLSSVSTGSGVKTIAKYNEYDPSGRFVIKSYENPASAINTFTYDIWGNVLTESDSTDPSNILTTTNTYNNWGRLTSSQAPDGRKTTSKIGWGDSFEKKYYILATASENPWVLTWYDGAGNEVLQESFGPKNVLVSKATSYNAKGLISQIQRINGKLSVTESFTYDDQGRLLTDKLSSGKLTSYSYGNRSVTTITAGRSYTKTTDAWGNLLTSADPAGGVVSYVYNSNGSPASITTNGSTVSMTYDAAGNQTSLTDPDAGTLTYEYAADGKILKQTDAKGVETVNTYDNMGRLSTVQVGENVIVNTYGVSGNEKLRLTKRTMGGNSVEYTHDKYGRVLTEKRNVSGKGSYSFAYQYDNRNRLAKTTYPGGLEVTYQYDDYGFKTATMAGGKVIYQLESYDGLTNKTSFMGSLTSEKTCDSFGYESNRKITRGNSIIENLDVKFDSNTDNLLSRKRNSKPQEIFGYDNLDRLISVKSGSATAMNITYAPNGNILSKTGIGNYTYNSGFKPHAVMTVDNAEGVIPADALTTSFNDFGKIQTIEDEGSNSKMEFAYGPDLQRWYTALSEDGEDIRTTVYAGRYEKITENGITREFYYLDGTTIVVKENGIFKPYLAFTDNLGSILSVVDEGGAKVFDASYDAWGRQAVALNTIGLHRGYTGHEMLSEFGIINMNGRLYDPVVVGSLVPTTIYSCPISRRTSTAIAIV